jgi:hypothetical protein
MIKVVTQISQIVAKICRVNLMDGKMTDDGDEKSEESKK